MDFFDAAGFFDETPVYDGYSSVLLFYGHTKPHDDHTSSGATSRRRTLTAADATLALMPARGVVKVHDTFWLVSSSHPDMFQGEQIRRSYGLKLSTGLMARLTPAEACAGAAGTAFHAHREYFRDTVDTRSEADWDVMWNIFCPLAEPIVKGGFFRQGSTLYRARTVYQSVDDYIISEADQFDADALQSATFTAGGTLNLVTDQLDTTSVVASVIQTDVTKFYQFRTAAENVQAPGDRTVFVPKSALTPKVGATFTMLSDEWRVLAVVSELDCWALHARLA